jgi:hypothetical protein
MRLLASAVAIAALASPIVAPAAAKTSTVSPPGNSGLTQYLEVVPTASGNKPSKNVKKDKSPLSDRQQQRLAKAGSDGRALLKVVSGTSPQHPSKPKRARKVPATTTATTPTVTQAQTTSAGKGKGVLATAFVTNDSGSGDGGLGIPLIVPMLVVAALAGGFALGRRRGDHGVPDDGAPQE